MRGSQSQKRLFGKETFSVSNMLDEFSPKSPWNFSEGGPGNVSFESRVFEQDFDQICLKVCLHPLHFVVKELLE